MRISSFLTFIVFCFILFMENFTEEEEAGMHLFEQLGALRTQLRNLQRGIKKQGASNSEAIDKIESLIEMVDNDTSELAGQGGMIREDIDIKKPVDDVQASISTYLKVKDSSPDDLNTLITNIDKICKDEIQDEVSKVIPGSF